MIFSPNNTNVHGPLCDVRGIQNDRHRTRTQPPLSPLLFYECICIRLDLFPVLRFTRDAEGQYDIFSFRIVNSSDMNFSVDRISNWMLNGYRSD